MYKSTFIISKMDCPSEEQMIRIKLEPLKEVKHLSFDIPNRKLQVYHIGTVVKIQSAVSDLMLSDVFDRTEESKLPSDLDDSQHRKILWVVLIINFVFFVLEMLYGWISKSMGLVADSLDMLADSIVYGLSLLAVGAAISLKKRVAKISGYFQISLAVFGLAEVIRRFWGVDSIPIFENMIIISLLALVANSFSLYLIQKANSKEAHMQASAIFTSNDIIINLGVIVAGGLVYWTQSKYPDLIIGLIIFLLVINGALRILKLSK